MPTRNSPPRKGRSVDPARADGGRGRAFRAPSGQTRREKKPGASDIADTLRTEIELGVRKPGDRLREVPLGTRFSVTRARIREALRILEAHGLVRIEPRLGASVMRLEDEDIMEAVRLRGLLWADAVRRAAIHLDKDERAGLRSLLKEIGALPRGPAEDLEAVYALSARLIRLIVEGARSRPLAALLRSLGAGVPRHFTRLSLATPEWRLKRAADVRRLGAAILARKAEEASRIASQMYQSSVDDALILYRIQLG